MRKEAKKMIWQTLLSIFQTLSGIFLVVFMSVHLFGNSLMTFGGEGWFNGYTSHLDKTYWFVKAAVWFVAFIILAHGVNGLRITYRYFRKIPEVHHYIADIKYRDSFCWYVHFITGFLMIFFVAFHLVFACLTAKAPVTTAEMVKEHLQNPYYFGIIILLLLSAIYHGLNGIKTIFIKYGVLLKYRKTIGLILAILGMLLAILGIINLFIFIK